MSRPNYRDPGVTAQNTLNYVNGLLAVEGFDTEEEKNSTMEHALAVCYSYLVQKRIQWTIYLEKLAELFLDLAFETEKHANIKDVLKQYRSITQSQYPDSLKHILEYYRDTKLQTILEEHMSQDVLEFVRNMSNIEENEPSSEIIISSFNPETKNKREEIREKLKIVWDGYKVIIDTVRVNQRFESVFKVTLKKIFEFVEQYNRKAEFKTFCEYLRSELRKVLHKRDKTDVQRSFYIDIEKEQVNTNNIEIRLIQFEVTIKLGLWQEAFEVLEDINELMKVRKGPVKNSMKCSYFEKLALLFKKSCYWHYHAYAFYNYYIIYITKSKLTADEKRKLSDKLILSVLCIPPSTLESHQSKESQDKIGAMMISSIRIPEKEQMQETMVSRGIIENASPEIKALWYFMFLEFDLASLDRGLQQLNVISRDQQYKEYISLLQDILIYKQLITISKVYQRMRYENLIKLIPLPKQKIQKILLESHQRKVIDFILDEKNGIISFEEKVEETNPYEEFLSVYTDVALLNEETRQYDSAHILKKITAFTQNSYDHYWNIRFNKIEDYKKKLKKPKQDLMDRQGEIRRKALADKQRDQDERAAKEQMRIEEEERKRDILIKKKVAVSDIISVKENRVVKIFNKKIENLTDQEIQEVEMDILDQTLEAVRNRVSNDNEKRNKKKFMEVDYMERERKNLLKDAMIKSLPSAEEEEKNINKIKDNSIKDFEQNLHLKKSIEAVAAEVKQKIKYHYDTNLNTFQTDLHNFKKNLTEEFKKKILRKARELYEEDKKIKEELEKRRAEQNEEQGGFNWSFKSVTKDQSGNAPSTESKWGRKTTTAESDNKQIESTPTKKVEGGEWGRKATTGKSVIGNNVFEQLQTHDQEKPKEEKGGRWNLGAKKEETSTNPQPTLPVPQEEKKDKDGWLKKKIDVNEEVRAPESQPNKFVPPPVDKSKGAWGAVKAPQKKEEVGKAKGKGKAW